jgi:hypothetical protein
MEDPFTGRRTVRGRLAIAWSAGQDGKLDYSKAGARVNKDNVYSWR